MPARPLTKRLFWTTEIVLLAATLGAAVWLARSGEWQPALLVALLVSLALLSESFSVQLSDGQLTASTVAIVLAMGLLGPAPAAACGIAAMILASARRGVAPSQWLSNLASFAAVPFAGGLAVRLLAEDFHVLHSGGTTQSLIFGLILLTVFVAALALNFVLVGLNALVEEGHPLRRQLPEFLPLLPGELAAGMLASILAVAYRSVGLPMLVAAIVVLLIFQHLTVALVRSEQRAEQLQARSRQLVGLQLGVLRTLVRALGMRDETSGRHAAAVASYATALGVELGCSEEERDVLRAAGLLHEIGKFTWPDRVLHAKSVEAEDMAIVKSHPQEGAMLVGALDGYGPVADAILYHHERIDGRGYPAGLIGQEIPLASRILAVCSTYDTMTAGRGYRAQMSPQEAIEELHVASRNGQLDPELVESFVALLERDGAELAHEPDFEAELEFERRIREMAEPASSEDPVRSPVSFARLGRRGRRSSGVSS
jgi:HD-GYP domain-containing protein (c-di-GMP phosphodiesterase class II)